MEKRRCYGCMRVKTASPVCEHCGYDERTANAPHQLKAGTVLRDQYLIGRVLGQGGFGITYLGWDQYLDIPVAIKEYYPTGTVMRESASNPSVTICTGDDETRFRNNRDRFMREAKTLARFSDVPEIVHIKNFFPANNTAYIVMEYVQGITLKEYVSRRGGRLSPSETFAILRPIMVGLSKIHRAGLIHRDISPDNIMMIPGGGAKLLDFGAVRDVGAAEVDKELTKSTEAILKQGYAPIEQYQHKGSLGPWTDVYALCATMYYCMTGTVPPDAPARMLGDEMLSFGQNISLTADQQRALIRGMALRAADRYPNMEALYLELFDTPIPTDASQPQQPKQPDPEPQDNRTIPVVTKTPDPPKKSKWWIFLLIALLIAGGAAAWFFLKPEEARLSDRPSATQPQATQPDAEAADNLPEEIPDSTEGQRPVIRNPEENTLMTHRVNSVNTGPTEYAFKTAVTREEVISITVLYTTQDAPEDAVDVSANGNGKVLAWTVENGEGYDLYLAAEGGIYAPADSEYLFAFFTNLDTIRFNGAFYTNDVENASAMFYKNENMTQLDVSGLNTSSMTDMSFMFSYCYQLTSLDVSGFDTSHVTDMNTMFQRCESLRMLDVSGFDTSKVTDMEYMFNGCSNVAVLDVSGFDTSHVTSMAFMFNECRAVETLDVSNFDTAKVTTMCSMFDRCGKLERLDVSGFNTACVTDMNSMFSECVSLKELDVSGFSTSKVFNMWGMFNECTALTRLDVSGFDTVRVTDMSFLFTDCVELQELDVSGFRTANVTTMESMFDGCGSLKALDVSGFDTGNVTDMSFMFAGCKEVQALDVSNFSTAKVTTMKCMFQECGSVRKLAVDNFNTRAVTDMSYMFTLCTSLQELNMSRFHTENVTDMKYMFNDCSSLTRLDVKSFNTAKVTSMEGMFENCSGLTYLGVGNFDTQRVQNMSSMFEGCAKLTYLDLNSFNTAAVTDMSYMFCECRGLKSLDVSGFDTSRVTDMEYMFYGCDSLTNLSLGTFDTSSVRYSGHFMEDGKKVGGRDWKTLFE